MAFFIRYMFVLLLTVNSAFGLLCYVCNTKDDKRCAVGISAITLKVEKCSSDGLLGQVASPECFRVKEYNKKDKTLKVARGCVGPNLGDCASMAGAAGWENYNIEDLSCDTCDIDKCNSGRMVKGLTITSIAMAAVVVFII